MHGPHRNNEEIYFKEREQELIQATREQLTAQATAAERASHRGKCPRCGDSLTPEQFHGIQVDRCPTCHGIWLDADEIDAVVAHEDHSLLTRVFDDVVAAMRLRRRS
ncbi:MAG: zf-TFIIB domain-containing protein [Gemmatimonadota bacterium]